MYIISGEFTVRPEYREELIEMSRKLIPVSLEEAGCLAYGFYEDQLHPDTFLFFERWRRREDISEHFEKSYFQDFAAQFPQMIKGDAKIEIHHVASTETV